MAAPFDFTVEAGASLPPIVFEYRTAADAVIPLTGYSAKLQARKTAKAATTLLDVTPNVNAAAGSVTLTLTAAETGALPAGAFPYALEVAHSSGEPVIRLAEGTMTVSAEVVR